MFVPPIVTEVSDNTNEIGLIFGVYNLGTLNTALARTDIIGCVNKSQYRPHLIIPNYIRDA
jgi:hypothetical protein